MLQGTGDTPELARLLRRTMSSPEVILWQALRTKPAGFKFRRQHPAGPYVVDFYCHAARLIIEVDGSAHYCGDRPARDARRDRWFEARGVAVMRIAAIEVLRDCDAVVHGIVATAAERLSELE